MPDNNTLNLADFLEEVSKAVIETQKGLNRESITYNQQLPDGVPPTHFAIPAVRADLRVGFRNLSAKGIDVVLFSNKEEKESYGESTVSFELVAAPPPPAASCTQQPNIPGMPVRSAAAPAATIDRVEELLGATGLQPPSNRLADRREAAIVFPLLRTGRDVVLWPSSAEPGSSTWEQMRVIVLRQGQLDTSLYRTPPEGGFLQLPSSALLDLDKRELANLVQGLSDLLVAIGRECASGSSQ